MTPNKKRKSNPVFLLKPALIAVLFASLFSGISTPAYSHPEKSEKDRETERVKNMTDKRDRIRARANEQREKAHERVTKARKDAAERRELNKEKADLRRAKNKDEQKKRLDFKIQLLEMLLDDGVITSKKEIVKITYSEGHPILNDIDLSVRFGKKYEELWTSHDRIISDQSYINITPQSYEIREITTDGKSRHFVMQTG